MTAGDGPSWSGAAPTWTTRASRIAEELNSQYLLGYTSSHRADGHYDSIRVRVPGTDYKVRARNGYMATPVR